MSERDENERGLSRTDEAERRDEGAVRHDKAHAAGSLLYPTTLLVQDQRVRRARQTQTNASPTISSMRCLISGVIFCTTSMAFIFS